MKFYTIIFNAMEIPEIQFVGEFDRILDAFKKNPQTLVFSESELLYLRDQINNLESKE